MPTRMSEYGKARMWARSAWARLDLAPPVDLQAVSDFLRIEVTRCVMPNDILGLYLRDKGSNCQIKLNRGVAEPRLRFTWAHEIGHHLFLIANDKDSIHARRLRRDRNRLESACDKFAVELLMPAEIVAREALALGMPQVDKLRTLAARFGVSYQAMALRLDELRISHSSSPREKDSQIPQTHI